MLINKTMILLFFKNVTQNVIYVFGLIKHIGGKECLYIGMSFGENLFQFRSLVFNSSNFKLNEIFVKLNLLLMN